MTKLEKVIALAQRDANACKRVLAVLNLNPHSPLYVIRDYGDGNFRPGELVRRIDPVQS